MTSCGKLSLERYIKAITGKKVANVVALDVREMSSVADAFILCSGGSNRQVSAIAEHVKKTLKREGTRPLHVEGMKEGQWVLMDYGDVIIHIFYEPVRTFYDLEGLWADAPRLALTESQHPGPTAREDDTGD
ncbi:MAG: ribosome silencing factor [Desulfobacterales bacterium]|jgi:ribosome-associated protein